MSFKRHLWLHIDRCRSGFRNSDNGKTLQDKLKLTRLGKTFSY